MTPPITSARDVAAYLLWLAAHECDDEPEYLTPLKLQKLLFYIQGWSYAQWDRPMFVEPIEAWRNGPVVRIIHDQYKQHGQSKPIITPLEAQPPATLAEEDRALVHAVWDAYKRYSGIALRDMTHKEQAYLETYTPQDPDGRCEKIIEPERIRAAFRGRASKTAGRLASKRDRLRAFARANTRNRMRVDTF